MRAVAPPTALRCGMTEPHESPAGATGDGPDADEIAGGGDGRSLDFGAVLVLAALLVVGAVVMVVASNVIRTWHLTGVPVAVPTTDRLQYVVDYSLNAFQAGFLLGAALLLMIAAVFSDAGSRWLDRALGITAAVAALVAVAALFAALEIPSWSGDGVDGGPLGNPYDDGVIHVSHALQSLSIVVLAGGAVAVCWMTVSGRVRDRLGDDDDEVGEASG